MEKDVVSYIEAARKHGLGDFEIKKNLLEAGWEAQAVEDSFNHLKAQEKLSGSVGPQVKAEELKAEKKFVSKEEQAPAPSYAPQATENMVPVMPATAISSSSATRNKKWLTWGLVGLGAVLLVGGGGYYYFSNGFSNYQKVWDSFVANRASTLYENTLSWSYEDKGLLEQSKENKKWNLRNVSFSTEGTLYFDNQDESNPQLKSDMSYTVQSGNTSFKTGIMYMLINKSLYINLSENPLLDAGFNLNYGEEKRYDWVKIDLEELANSEDKNPDVREAQEIEEIFTEDFLKELKKMWDDTTFVTVESYEGQEKLDGVRTLHFKNKLDKDAIRNLVNQYIDKVSARYKEKGREIPANEIEIAKVVAEEIIKRIEVKEFETWIGLKDFRLHKVHVVTSAPSLLSAIQVGREEVVETSGDAKRLADIRQMALALELYYNDYGGYPEVKDGQPLGLAPTYIGQIPTAPPPSGTCTEYYNSYWYQPKGSAIKNPQPFGNASGTLSSNVYSSYELLFCLGHDTGGYAAGIARLSERGIEDNIACPTTAEQCVNPNGSMGAEKTEIDKARETVSKIDFNGMVTINSSYKNIGQTQELKKPGEGEYFDLLQAMKKQREMYQSYYQGTSRVLKNSFLDLFE